MKNFLFRLFTICCVVNAFSDTQPFVVGTTSGYAPFVSLNDQNEYEGFDIDVARELARKLDRPLEIKDFGTMPSLMLALKQKKIDALIWAVSITQDRKKSFEIVHYQGDRIDTIPLLFWKRVPDNIQEISDLGKKTICVEAGSYQEDMMKTCPSITLRYFDNVQSAILDLKYGKSFASSIDPALLPRFLEKYPELKVLFLPLPQELQSEGNGICLNNPELAKKVQAAIDELKKEGTISKLENKWGLRDGS